jgi:hypothetical protein
MLSPKIAAIVSASTDLMKIHRNTAISYGMAHAELADAVGDVRRCPNAQQIEDFVDAADAFLVDLQEHGKAGSLEWRILADAIDEQRPRAMAA